MRIDFYHVDAFEVANYEPIWRELRRQGVDARLVAVNDNDWFDYARFETYCLQRNLPFFTESDPDADLGLTTQNATLLERYRRRVRLMYGPIVYPQAWGLQPHSVQPFDAVLVHGEAYVERFSTLVAPEKLKIIGYPRYDDFFCGKIDRRGIRLRWGIVDDGRPVLGFLPTWADNSGFDKFFGSVLRLADRYQIVLRPHHCTVRMEPQRMKLMRLSGLTLLDHAFDLSDFLAGVDVVVSDVRSGGLFEACICNVPTVGMVIDPQERGGWLARERVGEIAHLCATPDDMGPMLADAIRPDGETTARRNRWSNRHVAYRDGTAAQNAAKALIDLAVSLAARPVQHHLPKQAGQEPGVKHTLPVKVSVVLPTFNHAAFLHASINSILKQTFDDFELIVVNDGSTDDTEQMLAGFRHPKLRVINQMNRKLPAALNTGFAAARGEYYTWTSADNLVGPTWLEELVAALDDSPPDVGYALSHYATVDSRGRILSVINDQRFEVYRMFTETRNASFLYRSELARQVGGYDPALNGAEDLDLWLRMAQQTRAVLVESVLYYRLHADSRTGTAPDEIKDASRRTYLKFLNGSGGRLDVEELFPMLAESDNPAIARWQARVWLVGQLANNDVWPVETLVDLLLECLVEQYQPALVGNIVHLYASRGAWRRAGEAVARFGETDRTPYLQSLAGIVARQDRQALQYIPFTTFTEDKLSFNPHSQLSRAKLTRWSREIGHVAQVGSTERKGGPDDGQAEAILG